MQMRQVQNFDELKAPGDYMLTNRCNCGSGAEGEDLTGPVKHHYNGCINPQTHTGFILVCQCGGTFSSHKDHRVIQREPLTVRASWLCPKGCHGFIIDGVYRPC
jgi:hypothetical protein